MNKRNLKQIAILALAGLLYTSGTIAVHEKNKVNTKLDKISPIEADTGLFIDEIEKKVELAEEEKCSEIRNSYADNHFTLEMAKCLDYEKIINEMNAPDLIKSVYKDFISDDMSPYTRYHIVESSILSKKEEEYAYINLENLIAENIKTKYDYQSFEDIKFPLNDLYGFDNTNKALDIANVPLIAKSYCSLKNYNIYKLEFSRDLDLGIHNYVITNKDNKVLGRIESIYQLARLGGHKFEEVNKDVYVISLEELLKNHDAKDLIALSYNCEALEFIEDDIQVFGYLEHGNRKEVLKETNKLNQNQTEIKERQEENKQKYNNLDYTYYLSKYLDYKEYINKMNATEEVKDLYKKFVKDEMSCHTRYCIISSSTMQNKNGIYSNLVSLINERIFEKRNQPLDDKLYKLEDLRVCYDNGTIFAKPFITEDYIKLGKYYVYKSTNINDADIYLIAKQNEVISYIKVNTDESEKIEYHQIPNSLYLLDFASSCYMTDNDDLVKGTYTKKEIKDLKKINLKNSLKR